MIGLQRNRSRCATPTPTSSASARSVGRTNKRNYSKMKQILTALTIAASFMASSASAFEMNTTSLEENKMLRKPMVGDLAVGVKALLSNYGLGCVRNGKIYLYSHKTLETDPKVFNSYYEIIKQADGEFAVTFGPSERGDKEIAHASDWKCEYALEDNAEAIFYPVKSINGFTDRRSFLIDLINQGYE